MPRSRPCGPGCRWGSGKRPSISVLLTYQGIIGHLADADVLVCDWRRSRLEASGVTPEALLRRFPYLVFVSTTPYGLVGPYADLPATDLTVQALSGYVSLNGLPGREPLKGPANVLPLASGVSAFVGALAALHERARSGQGQLVDASNLEAVASMVPYLRTAYTGRPAVQ